MRQLELQCSLALQSEHSRIRPFARATVRLYRGGNEADLPVSTIGARGSEGPSGPRLWVGPHNYNNIIQTMWVRDNIAGRPFPSTLYGDAEPRLHIHHAALLWSAISLAEHFLDRIFHHVRHEVMAEKPSLTLSLGTNGLKVTSEPPPMAGQAGCLQGQDRSAVTIQAAATLDVAWSGYLAITVVPTTLRHW
ncbi:hypothetical protein J6590_004379 [Homalodisca vitripennis]|nr:hypothetical protein J6590_004379 [Homalodisca vitripennis]